MNDIIKTSIDIANYGINAFFGYFALLIIFSLFGTTMFNKKIQSQEELDKIVDEEARKLGLDPDKIDAKYFGQTTGAEKVGERYELHLGKELLKTRNSVRHELYHIKRDCDRGKPPLWKYLFVAEPRAELYATLGWRL